MKEKKVEERAGSSEKREKAIVEERVERSEKREKAIVEE